MFVRLSRQNGTVDGRSVMGNADRHLDVPEVAIQNEASLEVARIWIAEECQHVNVRIAIWEDPRAWGILLADFARHVSSAYAQQDGADHEKILIAIRDQFADELNGLGQDAISIAAA